MKLKAIFPLLLKQPPEGPAATEVKN